MEEAKYYMKECKRHRWRVGAEIGTIQKNTIGSEGKYIWCERCNKKIKAYYNKLRFKKGIKETR